MAATTTTTYNSNKVSTCSHIHNDIAITILSKLPFKSLKRFSCVHKSWSLLLQNPNFINMFHTNILKFNHNDDDDDTTRLLLMKTTWGVYPPHDSLCIVSGERFEDCVKLDWPSPFQENDSCIEILGYASVNGVFCIFRNDYDYDYTNVLWNPATGEFKVIPPSHEPEECNCEPAGFGYDSVGDDYKVIRIARYTAAFEGNWILLPEKKNSLIWDAGHEESLDEMLDYEEFWEGRPVSIYDDSWEIYSLRSNSWKKLDDVDLPDTYRGKSHVNLNEFCHWLVDSGQQHKDMVSFDFINETFLLTTLPSLDFYNQGDFITTTCRTDLMVLNRFVAFVLTVFPSTRPTSFHIWILGELSVKESWTKLFVVEPLTRVRWPIGFGIKSVLFYKKDNEELARFDLSTQTVKETVLETKSMCLKIVIYKESLLPIGGMDK